MRYTPGRLGKPATKAFASNTISHYKSCRIRALSAAATFTMAKVEAVEIRPGQLLEWDKRVWRVLKSYHVHVGGRGGAFMQVEMKDIEAGTKTNQRFRTEDKIERAYMDPREMQYLYQDGDSYVFMDKENYEQLSLSAEFLEGQAGFLLPNTDVQVNFYNGRPIGVELPPSVFNDTTATE